MSSTHRAVRRPLRRRLTAVSVLAAGTLLLAACGGNDDTDGMDHGTKHSATAKEPGKEKDTAAAGFNDADVSFAQGMIPHHQQALDMAELAEDRASDAEIKKLAGQIEKAQDPEIKLLQGWLKSWGKPTETDPGMDHSGHTGMDGMMSEQDMKDLEAAKGKDFDRAFAEMMIKHHEGAIAMAKAEQKNGKSADAKKLAAAIVKGQSAEVAQFEKILDRL